jgi:flagellar hook-associated protein 2
MTISSPGIGSNLDVNSIVEKLMSVERRPLDRLSSQQTSYQAELSAFGTLQGALSAFQTAIQGLSNRAQFLLHSATVSDSTVLGATAGTDATPGSYSVEVRELAQQQKLASAGFASTADTLGSGTISIQFGTYDGTGNTFRPNLAKASQTITVPAGSNTLAGVRDAINAANVGVTATILNDGSTNGNRLVLTSKDSGAANGMKITISDDDGNSADASGLSQLAFDPVSVPGSGRNLSDVQTARDAVLVVDGITVTKPSNLVTDAIQGVTLSLMKPNAGSTVALTVATNSAAIKATVSGFVEAFTSVNKTIRDLTGYDPSTKRAGALQGDSSARSALSQIRRVLTQSIDSAGERLSLSQIGVSFQRDGTLAVDDSRLQQAIDQDLEGVASLFAATARTTDGRIEFLGSLPETQSGSYAVSVSRLATSGSLVGTATPNLTIAAGVNDQVDLSIDGAMTSVTLRAGTYPSAGDVATELQTAIAATGRSVSVTVEGGVISIRSSTSGGTSAVMLTGGIGASDLLGPSPVATSGSNVAGTVNGVNAIGSGQILTGATGDASAGLALKVLGGPLGERGNVTFTQGYASILDQLVDSFLGEDGLLFSRTDGINSTIRRIGQSQEAMQNRLDQVEKRYREQFTALDATISNLQQTSSFLTQQLAILAKNYE